MTMAADLFRIDAHRAFFDFSRGFRAAGDKAQLLENGRQPRTRRVDLQDLLDQVRNAAPQPEMRVTAKRAIDAIRRGVVAVDAG